MPYSFCLRSATRQKEINFLSILKVDSPKRVTIDFEVAVRNSIIATHQSAQIQFCFFHMSQSVWRHVQSSGNTHNYNSDLTFRELIRMLLATTFLPVEDVPTAFELLQGMASEESQPIFNYFEDTYIGRLLKDDRSPDLIWSNGVAIKE